MARQTAAQKAAAAAVDSNTTAPGFDTNGQPVYETDKVRKARDTTPVELLSEITVTSAASIPVGARQRTENPFTDAVKDTYDQEFWAAERDEYATAQVDNVFRAVKQLNSAAQALGLGVRVLVQDVDGGYDRASTRPGTVWFRGKPKNERKPKDTASA